MNNQYLSLIILTVAISMIGMTQTALADGAPFQVSGPIIPPWIKNNAGWWANGQINDSDFVKGIQYMVQNGIINISPTPGGNLQNSNQIPQWIKNDARWWAQGQVGDSEFVKGMQYLVQVGIIQVSLVQQVNQGQSATSDIFANCSITGGCIADCAPPAADPIATGNSKYDLYDGCILAGMKVAGMTQTWQGQILKAQMMEESGLSPSINTSTYSCGGMNCGQWAVSAGSISGDHPPGPCGSSKIDPATGQVDYSHSYGLFQSTPACDGVFALTTSLDGHTCTPTTTANLISFGSSVYFYCESATSINGGQHYIDAVQDTSSALYAKSAFNPAYQIYVYFAQWGGNYATAVQKTNGCTEIQDWYLTMAYWLTGNQQSSCTLSGSGHNYVQAIINDYQNQLYGTAWAFSFS